MNLYLQCPRCKKPINHGDRVHINVFEHTHWNCVAEHPGADSVFDEQAYFSDLLATLDCASRLSENVRKITPEPPRPEQDHGTIVLEIDKSCPKLSP